MPLLLLAKQAVHVSEYMCRFPCPKSHGCHTESQIIPAHTLGWTGKKTQAQGPSTF